jgi:sigma-B regulation protein RsbU (phosphoserine phosphatase)
VEFSVGGHNPPYLLKQDGVEAMEVNAAVVVGVLSDAHYETASLQLAPGEGIFLYTDGVTEALDAAEVLFSEERLEELLGEVKDEPPEDIVRRVVGDVRKHAGGVPQSDDVTVMAIRYHGSQ